MGTIILIKVILFFILIVKLNACSNGTEFLAMTVP